MAHRLLIFLVFFVCHISQEILAADDYWMDEPYGNKDYNYHVKYAHNITMVCNDSSITDLDVVQYWIRPDLHVMFPGDFEYFYTLDGYAGWSVNATTGDLDVVIVQESQFGFYHCVLLSDNVSSNVHVVKKALNYEEAYFGSLWDSYELNTIIGVSAAAGFALICVCLMLICKYRVNPDDDDDDDDDMSDNDKDHPEDGPSSEHSGSQKGDMATDDVLKNVMIYNNAGFEVHHEKVITAAEPLGKLDLTESTVL